MAYPDSMQPDSDPGEDVKKPYGEKSPADLAKEWERELNASAKWLRKFQDNARRIERKYTDRRDSGAEGESHYNIFWSNVQVVLASVYGRLPKAEVSRAFEDFDDDVARVAGTMMQRILNQDLMREHDNSQSVMRDALQDRFVAGLGQAWVRYDAQTEQIDLSQQLGLGGGTPIMTEVVVKEEAPLDYVRWEDFLYSPVRRWRDVRWVARRSYMTRDKLIRRFGEEIGRAVPLKAKSSERSEDDPLKASPQRQAEIWEIWSLEERCIYWHCKGYDVILDHQDDYLGLEGFFPCPEPVVATTGTEAYLPVADYIMCADQYNELNDVTERIAMLTKAIRVAGVYDKNNDGVQRILSEGTDNTLIPVDNWALHAERGGLKGAVDWFPVDMVTEALLKLKDRKRELMQELYELLGISDIMRGVSAASETATAQSLKVQYGGARFATLQGAIARFVAGCLRLRAEVIANHFQPQTILERSQIDKTPDAPYAQQALQLLKDKGMAKLRLEVNADSMSAPDWQAEKEQRIEYITAISTFIERVSPMIQQNPGSTPFLVKILQWAAAGFRSGKQIESVLDQALNALTQQQMQPPEPPQPKPDEIKALASAEKYQAEAEKTRAEVAVGTGLPSSAFSGPKPGGPGVGGGAPPTASSGPGGPPLAPPMPSAPMPKAPM